MAVAALTTYDPTKKRKPAMPTATAQPAPLQPLDLTPPGPTAAPPSPTAPQQPPANLPPLNLTPPQNISPDQPGDASGGGGPGNNPTDQDSGGGGTPPASGGWTLDKVRQWMKDHGVAQSIIDQEATNDLLRYGDQLEGVLNASLPNWLKRGGSGQSGAPGSGGGGSGFPGNQFDDPYTKMLEEIAKRQMGDIWNSPYMKALNEFLSARFKQLTEHPGYSNEDLALMNTQAFEPIEALRAADTKRSMERTAARGFLPSSGLAELDLRDVDQRANQLRTQASRDLAINAINKRASDLDKALQIGQLQAVGIPQGQRSEELALASLLYDLPHKALQDALAVLNGTPASTDLFDQVMKMMQQNRNNSANTSSMWAMLAQLLAGMKF